MNIDKETFENAFMLAFSLGFNMGAGCKFEDAVEKLPVLKPEVPKFVGEFYTALVKRIEDKEQLR